MNEVAARGLEKLVTTRATLKIGVRHLARIPSPVAWLYLLLITMAELLTAVMSTQLGVGVHSVLLIACLVHGVMGQVGPERGLILSLALAPLTRVLSLSLPLARFPQLLWYPMVSLPLLIATWMTIRLLRVPRHALGLRLGDLVTQLLFALTGLGIGALEYLVLRPKPLLADTSWGMWLFGALMLILFTGFSEELIFRGLSLSVAWQTMGRWALLYVSLLFAVLHIGYQSSLDVILVFAVGLLFALGTRLSGSILGVALAHGLANVTLFMVMPRIAPQPSAVARVTLWLVLGSVVTIGLIALREYAKVAASMRPNGHAWGSQSFVMRRGSKRGDEQ